MKKFLALGLGCLLAQGAMAQAVAPVAPVLPEVPADCDDQIADNGLYCSNKVITGSKVNVSFVAVVSKDDFPTVQSIIDRYVDFAAWPTYAKASNQTVIEFDSKLGSTVLTKGEDADGQVTYRHQYKYALKVQGIPLLKQSVFGGTDNTILTTPSEGALGTLVFTALTPADGVTLAEPIKGLKSQIGSVHALECTGLAVCDETKWLLVYETTVEPEVSFAMNIAGNTVAAGIEDLLVGMLDTTLSFR